MKPPLLIFIIFFCVLRLNAIGQQLSSDVEKLQSRIQQTEQANRRFASQLHATEARLLKKLIAATDSIASLQTKLAEANASIQSIQKELSYKINKSEEITNGKIKDTNGKLIDLSQNTLYWIIAVLAIAFLSLLLFWLLRNKFVKANTSLSDSIQNTKKAMEDEGIRLDTKLTDLLESQLNLLNQQRQAAPDKTKRGRSLAGTKNGR